MRVFPYNKYESKMDGHWAHLLVPLCSHFLVAAVLLLFVLWSRVVSRVQRTRVSNCSADDTAMHLTLCSGAALLTVFIIMQLSKGLGDVLLLRLCLDRPST